MPPSNLTIAESGPVLIKFSSHERGAGRLEVRPKIKSATSGAAWRRTVTTRTTGLAQLPVLGRGSAQVRQKIRLLISGIALHVLTIPLVLAPASHADPKQDQSYLSELNRIGFTGNDSTVFIAQQTCREIDRTNETKSRDPIVVGLDMTLVNLAKGNWTVNQLFAVTGAAISTYCPQYSKDFYATVGQWKITLP